MLNIAKLFGKSPFSPLQTHIKKVASCIDKLTAIFETLFKADLDKIEKLAADLSTLEEEADLTKNDIRNHLPRSLFLPIDRHHFLDILSIQDTIADKAEEIGLLLTLHPLEKLPALSNELQLFYKKNLKVFLEAKEIIEEIDELLESSFGGIEAEKVKTMVEQTAHREHEVQQMKHLLLKQLFKSHASLPAPSFYLWVRLVEEVGHLSQLSEKLANRIRMVLELK